MSMKDDYVAIMESQIKAWDGEVDKLTLGRSRNAALLDHRDEEPERDRIEPHAAEDTPYRDPRWQPRKRLICA